MLHPRAQCSSLSFLWPLVSCWIPARMELSVFAAVLAYFLRSLLAGLRWLGRNSCCFRKGPDRFEDLPELEDLELEQQHSNMTAITMQRPSPTPFDFGGYPASGSPPPNFGLPFPSVPLFSSGNSVSMMSQEETDSNNVRRNVDTAETALPLVSSATHTHTSLAVVCLVLSLLRISI